MSRMARMEHMGRVVEAGGTIEVVIHLSARQDPIHRRIKALPDRKKCSCAPIPSRLV